MCKADGKKARCDVIRVDDRREQGVEIAEDLTRLAGQCDHRLTRVVDDEVCCALCGQSFGFYCLDSPDNVCHYFTVLRDGNPVIQLVDGSLWEDLPLTHRPDYESDHWCIFCGRSRHAT